MNLSKLTTEKRNPGSVNIDQISTIKLLQVINNEDKKVANKVEMVLPEVAIVVEKVMEALSNGGRLFYVGAGTSGRIGITDASECPPTFMTDPEMIQTVMAGGNTAFFQAVEGAEDNEQQGAVDLKTRGLTKKDVVIGITASGRTPYPIGALKYAQSVGAYAVSLTCNKNSEISRYADTGIEVVVGPEVLTGSTRMKAATAHKMILNMISTSTMVKLGKVYENLMVDLHASNYKLKERAKSIIMEITDVPYEKAGAVLDATNNEVKPAIVMIEAGVDFEKAKDALDKSKGYVRKAIEYLV
ncbi:N-acetylmuramic acid 6-phosphate etherase [Oceanobacillus halophilus]|uniref:N-acetylmuramic acid 6-phosphate etherase n=1 Tax=Oceanobacillus halophilus TaxID=930130 RepID=A0A494ZZY4_9BACI|nr:N-acetylmuramic acid 6-phosphate etherase [Oceanobacillus halophilus]RKQ32549.1 N-acetylmuramic acid 6-phosphate etherase [Oceanobacillus halophilus]